MSSDRKALIRLASTLEKGSEERRVLLAELQKSAQDLDNDYFNSVVDALPRRVGSWNVSNEYGAALFEGNTGWEFGGMPAFSFYARPESGFGGGEVVVDLQIGEDGYGGPGTFSVKWTGDAKKDAGVLLSSLQKNWGKIKGYWMKELSSGISNSLRLASTLPKGSEESRTLLAELQKQSAPPPFPPGTPLQEKLECISDHLNRIGADRAEYNEAWWEKAGVETCPVCGSTDTHVTDSLRFNEHRGRAVSECKNCDSDWLWEAEAKWVEGACRIKWIGEGKGFKGKPARGSVYETMLSAGGIRPQWCEGK